MRSSLEANGPMGLIIACQFPVGCHFSRDRDTEKLLLTYKGCGVRCSCSRCRPLAPLRPPLETSSAGG